MKGLIIAVFCLAASISLWAQTATNSGIPKGLPLHVAYRPTFLTPDFSHTTGMAFILRLAPGGPAFLATCHHLFGPAAGFPSQLDADAIERVFIGAAAVSMSDRKFMITASPYLKVPNARASDQNGCERDIALFRLNGWAAGPALTLAFADAIPGDTGWLLMRDPQGTALILSRVTVVFITPNEVRYFLEDQTIDLSGCSGAPVVSPEGLVIAMHNGGFTPASGRRYGFGTPVNALRTVVLEVDPLALPTARVVIPEPAPPQPAPKVDLPPAAPAQRPQNLAPPTRPTRR